MNPTIIRVIVCAGVICILGLTGCQDDGGNPAGPDKAQLVGHWIAVDTVIKGGASAPDTFDIDLHFSDQTSYTLSRSMMVHASSGTGTPDSAWESGTWALSGGTVTLTAAHCKRMSYATWTLEDVACDPAPKTLAVAISGNKWTFSLAEWKNGSLITYHTTKQ